MKGSRCCITSVASFRHGAIINLVQERSHVVQGHLQFFMKEHEEAMKTYEQGLSHDKDNQELKEGLMRCQQAINKVWVLVCQAAVHVLVAIITNLFVNICQRSCY